ncbi:MAG: sodium ion-translocating decarboxylase subunit beta [Alphaproteobacteria bacterium]|jgi:oxaloacetate decarboxylase beta subunit|nr:sodium ion-translocating decarboxylase subunit beta [Alphaproteobacteria bacterium]
MIDTLTNYFLDTGFGQLQLGNLVMIGIGLLFILMAIVRKFEPLLLVPIGFGILIGNIPYDTAELSLGVHDGPVASDELAYYHVSFADEQGVGSVLYDGERYSMRAFHEALARRARVSDRARQGRADWSHARLMAVIEAADAVYLDRARRIGSASRAADPLDRGVAVMVNENALLRPKASEIDRPGIYPAGQGRRVFVTQRMLDAGERRFPTVWSRTRQDPSNASVLWWLFAGVGFAGFYPPLIFLGVGALTDFGPLMARPKTILLGAAAQFGIFGALFGALLLGRFVPGIGFGMNEAASIGIIGGADGPTSIFVCSQLAPELLGAVALAAYAYMAMVPIIQPPIMKLLTGRAERRIRMSPPRNVSKRMKTIFPIVGFILTAFIAPGGLPLLGMLFFGNLLRESLVTDRLARTSQSAFIDIVTILLGVTVGAKTQAATFLTWETIGIFVLGIVAFAIATATGVLFAKLMNLLSKEKINPLIGAAGVSAVPMAARVVHTVAQEEDPQNYLLMHAMGPNVAGVIGSTVAAGVLLSSLG